MKFKDIPQFPPIYYSIDTDWDCIEPWLERQAKHFIQLDPDNRGTK